MFSKFNSIKQFREIVKTVKHLTYYDGEDDRGEIIYDMNRDLPKIRFIGTVKLHGTNSCIAKKPNGEIFYQSRSQIIDAQNDNAGFVRFCEQNKKYVEELFQGFNLYFQNEIVYIYGEWVGKGIQKGTAIHELDPAFYIFEVKIIDVNKNEFIYTGDVVKRSEFTQLRNIYDYKTFSIDIDFANLEKAKKQLQSYVEEVEQCCPVAKEHDFEGLGEGIVWVRSYGDNYLKFKTKGDKHKIAATKEKVQIEPEKLNSINEFVNYAVTKNRFEQALAETTVEIGDMSNFGKVIRWIHTDILKEESDVLEANKLAWKDVSGFVSRKIKELFV